MVPITCLDPHSSSCSILNDANCNPAHPPLSCTPSLPGPLSVTQHGLNQDGIEVVKLATRALVYFHVPSKTPMFFDSDGRNNLFPTVYAMWRLQANATAASGATVEPADAGAGGACCPPLVVHPPVSKFVLNGADIMLPGGYCINEPPVWCTHESRTLAVKRAVC